MKRKTLAEWIQVAASEEGSDAAAQPHPELAFDNALAGHAGVPYAELSQLLASLRYLAMLHQTHHWVAKGDPFYSDHKLFEELYQRTLEDIDDVAEKAVGLGCEQNVALSSQLCQIVSLARSQDSPQTVPQASDLAKASLCAERNLLTCVVMALQSMDQGGTTTPGVENLLQQVADRHERHVYLLGRKCSQNALGM